jgi:hypothetical protein
MALVFLLIANVSPPLSTFLRLSKSWSEMTTLGRLPGAAAGAAGAAANRFYRTNEHGFRAMFLERSARLLRERPQRFGAWATALGAAQQRGPQAFAAAIYLAQQNDANVRAALSEDEQDQAPADMVEEGSEDIPMLEDVLQDPDNIPLLEEALPAP